MNKTAASVEKSSAKQYPALFGHFPHPVITKEQLQSIRLRHAEGAVCEALGSAKPLLTWTKPGTNQQFSFLEKEITGDSWCLFHAVGCNPADTLQELMANLNRPEVNQQLADSIYNDLYSGELTSNDFRGYLDAEGQSIKDRLEFLLNSSSVDDKHENMTHFRNYISQLEVQNAYLDYIKENGYGSLSVIKAYLSLKHKKLFLLQVNTNGLLTSLSADEINPQDPDVVCVIYRPHPTHHMRSHYNKLSLVSHEFMQAQQVNSFAESLENQCTN